MTRLTGALVGLALGLAAILTSHASAMGLDPAYSGAMLGPARAAGAVVWSHGRSLDSEDWKSPTPPYLNVLKAAGWDVLRFDRRREGDTLRASSRRLADYAAALKRDGYRRVVLAGQSFGAFLSLTAADESADVDAVVATAPAAFGNFQEFYGSWRENATRLYPLLQRVEHARVMLFYFHDDDFDPGGRGERSAEILASKGLGYAVVDQPAYLTGHWAASTGLFERRFAGCIRRFIDDDRLKGELVCTPRWGETPSAQLKLPPELRDRPAARRIAAIGPAAPLTAVTAGSGGRDAGRPLRDMWYGFYPNGREVLLAIDRVRGHDLSAIYAIGPSIDDKYPSGWSRRQGHILGKELIFASPGQSTLRFRLRANGSLAATWTSAGGRESMTGILRPIDPFTLTAR